MESNPKHAAYIEIVVWLLRYGASTHVVNSYGQTPLLVAAAHGLAHVVDLVLKAGCDMLVADRLHGSTALTIAAIRRDVEVMKVVLGHAERAGVTTVLLDKRDNRGKVAEDHACSGERRSIAIVSMLRTARAAACVQDAIASGLFMAKFKVAPLAAQPEVSPPQEREADFTWENGMWRWHTPSTQGAPEWGVWRKPRAAVGVN